jgi:hypothetical protein
VYYHSLYRRLGLAVSCLECGRCKFSSPRRLVKREAAESPVSIAQRACNHQGLLVIRLRVDQQSVSITSRNNQSSDIAFIRLTSQTRERDAGEIHQCRSRDKPANTKDQWSFGRGEAADSHPVGSKQNTNQSPIASRTINRSSISQVTSSGQLHRAASSTIVNSSLFEQSVVSLKHYHIHSRIASVIGSTKLIRTI